MSNITFRLSELLKLFSANLLLVANLVAFTSFSIYSGNPAEFEVGYLDMLFSQWQHIALLFCLLIAPGLFLPGKLLPVYTALILVLGILVWLQSNFLMWDYGVFDGRATAWEQWDLYGWLDLALWIAVAAIAIYFARHIIPHVNTIAWILLFAQSILLFGQPNNTEGFWTRDFSAVGQIPAPMLEVSSTANIFHLILDSYQTDVFLELVEEAGLQDEFTGFTLFYDNAGVAPYTSFSLPAVFSGKVFDGSQSPSAYYADSIKNGFQNHLLDAGYRVNLIPQISMREGRFSNYYEIPSTYQGSATDLVNLNSAQLADVTLFRSAPHFVRKWLYNDGNWLVQPLIRGEIEVRSFQEKAFFTDYIAGLAVGSEEPAYHFLHLMPPHPPYVTLADGGYAGHILANTRKNFVNEARAVLELIRQYIAKLKSLGVYDDAVIILQGDHGSQINPMVDGIEVHPCVPRLAALLAIKDSGNQESLVVSHAPTSLLDVAPTILHNLGEDVVSVFDLDASAPRQRPFVIFHGTGDAPTLDRYVITGSVFSPSSCKKPELVSVSVGRAQYTLGAEIQFGMTGNADPFLGAGWGAQLTGHCWTSGQLSSLRFPIDQISEDLVLKARLIPFISEDLVPRQRIRVSVAGRRVGQWIAESGETHEFSVVIPQELLAGDQLQIDFELPDAASPKALGVGGDERLLGFAMLTAKLEVSGGVVAKQDRLEIPDYGFGQEVTFGVGGSGIEMLGAGWSRPEQTGSNWSVAASASLHFAMDPPAGDVVVKLGLLPFLVAEQVASQRVVLYVNKTQIADWEFNETGSRSVTASIPRDLIQDGVLRMELALPDAIAPASVGAGVDVRPLAVAIESLRIY